MTTPRRSQRHTNKIVPDSDVIYQKTTTKEPLMEDFFAYLIEISSTHDQKYAFTEGFKSPSILMSRDIEIYRAGMKNTIPKLWDPLYKTFLELNSNEELVRLREAVRKSQNSIREFEEASEKGLTDYATSAEMLIRPDHEIEKKSHKRKRDESKPVSVSKKVPKTKPNKS